MTYTPVAAAGAVCLMWCYVRLGRVTEAHPAPSGTPSKVDSPRTVTASLGVNLKPSNFQLSTPSILQLATVQQQADMDPELAEFRKLMNDCGATFYLEQTRDMTMLMPTNEAVQALLPIDIHKLPWEVKWKILQYHIIPQEIVNVEEIPWEASKLFNSWEGSPIKIQHAKQRVRYRNKESTIAEVYLINDIASVVSDPPRTENFNGASYKINRVLIPPGLDLRTYETSMGKQRQQGMEKQNEHLLTEVFSGPLTKTFVTAGGGENNFEADDDRKPTRAQMQSRSSNQNSMTPAGHTATTTGDGTQAPEFLREINHQHARWSQNLYLGSAPRISLLEENTTNTTSDFVPLSAAGSSTAEPAPYPSSNIKALTVDDLEPKQADTIRIQTDAESLSAGLLNPPHFSVFDNYLHLPLEPLLVGSGVQEENFRRTEGMETNHATPDSSLLPSSSSPLNSASTVASSIATVTSLQSGGARRNRSSLFSSTQQFQPYVASPSIAALGLAEGLLPEEELVTDYWSKPRDTNSGLGITSPLKRSYASAHPTVGPMGKLAGLVDSIKGP